MIFRDDDISVTTDLAVLKPVHDKFKAAIVMHTIAVIAKDLDQNKDLVAYLKRENFDIQLHCWEHINLVENKKRLASDIELSLAMFEKCGIDRPTILACPWNISDSTVIHIAKGYGLEIPVKSPSDKCSLSYYVSHNGNVPHSTVNFHYWDDECKDLDEALRIYNTKR